MTWPLVQLGEVCEFKYGKSLAAGQRKGGSYAVYGSNGQVGSHSAALSHGPTIIIGRKGSYGEVAYSPDSCWPIDTTYYVDGSTTRANLKWLSYRLRALGLTGLNRAAAVPGLNREDAYRQRLLLPPIDQQCRIAAILDQADALRSKRRIAMEHSEGLGLSIFLDMFGDPDKSQAGQRTIRFGEIADLQGGRNLVADDSDARTPFQVLKISAVTSGTFKPGEAKPLPVDYTPPDAHLVRQGDLLISRANTAELVGAVAYVDSCPSNLVLPDKIWRFLWKDPQSVPLYYWALFRTPRIRQQISRLASGTGGSMKNISKAKLEQLELPYADPALQRAFYKRLAAIPAPSAAEFDELFASLQSRAFSGQL